MLFRVDSTQIASSSWVEDIGGRVSSRTVRTSDVVGAGMTTAVLERATAVSCLSGSRWHAREAPRGRGDGKSRSVHYAGPKASDFEDESRTYDSPTIPRGSRQQSRASWIHRISQHESGKQRGPCDGALRMDTSVDSLVSVSRTS